MRTAPTTGAQDDAWSRLQQLLPSRVAEVLANRLERARAREESAQPVLSLRLARGRVVDAKLNADESIPLDEGGLGKTGA